METVAINLPSAIVAAIDRDADALGVSRGEFLRAVFRQGRYPGEGSAAMHVEHPGAWSIGVRNRDGVANAFLSDYVCGLAGPETPPPARVPGFFHPEDAPILASFADLETDATGALTGRLSPRRRTRRRRARAGDAGG